MTRRELRENIFKLLFLIEFFDTNEWKEQIGLYLDCLDNIAEKDTNYMKDKVDHILENLGSIDQKINVASKGWKTTRMGKVDLTLIRLALFEMDYEEDIPVGVAINEAVELSKLYGTDDSSSFVNGILAKLT